MLRLHDNGVAIIGSGRWARVYASIILNSKHSSQPLYLCSPTNNSSWQAWAEEHGAHDRVRICTFDEVLETSDITNAIVVRKPIKHAETSIKLLQKNKRVLVEKPLCNNMSDLKLLSNLAEGNSLWVSSVLLHNQDFRFLLQKCFAVTKATKVEILWSDEDKELRWGALKTYDPDITIAEDVLPHFWTILRVIFPTKEIAIDEIKIKQMDNFMDAFLSAGHTKIIASANRLGMCRQRSVCFHGEGGAASIDFATWPARCIINDRRERTNAKSQTVSPLTLQIKKFVAPLDWIQKTSISECFQINQEVTEKLLEYRGW